VERLQKNVASLVGANHYLVQTTVRDVKVKEKNKIIKVFGRSPQPQ
jgi:hypothetical protein